MRFEGSRWRLQVAVIMGCTAVFALGGLVFGLINSDRVSVTTRTTFFPDFAPHIPLDYLVGAIVNHEEFPPAGHPQFIMPLKTFSMERFVPAKESDEAVAEQASIIAAIKHSVQTEEGQMIAASEDDLRTFPPNSAANTVLIENRRYKAAYDKGEGAVFGPITTKAVPVFPLGMSTLMGALAGLIAGLMSSMFLGERSKAAREADWFTEQRFGESVARPDRSPTR